MAWRLLVDQQRVDNKQFALNSTTSNFGILFIEVGDESGTVVPSVALRSKNKSNRISS